MTLIYKLYVFESLEFFLLKEILYAHHGCIYLIKNILKTVIFWNLKI